MHESEKWKWSRSVVSNSLQPHGLQPTRLPHPWDFPGKSTGVGCHCLLHSQQQGIFIPPWVDGLLPHSHLEVSKFPSLIKSTVFFFWGLSQSLSNKESACNAGDMSSIPGWGRFLPKKFHRQRSLEGWGPWSCKVRCNWAPFFLTWSSQWPLFSKPLIKGHQTHPHKPPIPFQTCLTSKTSHSSHMCLACL